ncbi:MAG: YraN family protein [Actinomycetota bacterium]
MTFARQGLGRFAERHAASRLAAEGFSIVARNARVRTPEVIGEIDLIAIDRGVLVFVEVKAGRVGARAGPERPALAVGARKQRRVRRLARAWLAEAAALPRFRGLRFDVIGVRVDARGRVAAYEHLRGAF